MDMQTEKAQKVILLVVDEDYDTAELDVTEIAELQALEKTLADDQETTPGEKPRSLANLSPAAVDQVRALEHKLCADGREFYILALSC